MVSLPSRSVELYESKMVRTGHDEWSKNAEKNSSVTLWLFISGTSKNPAGIIQNGTELGQKKVVLAHFLTNFSVCLMKKIVGCNNRLFLWLDEIHKTAVFVFGIM